MTLEEFDTKIDSLKIVRSKATGLKRAELTEIIDGLETARVEDITEILRNIEIPEDNIQQLNEIATTFDQATEEINNASDLIDNAIGFGRTLVGLFA